MLRAFAVNVLAQGFARVLSIFANLFLVVCVARAMGTDTFGQFSYVLAFSAVAAVFADLGTTAVLARGLAMHDGGRRARFLGNFLLLRFALVGAVSALAAGFALVVPFAEPAALLVVAAGLPAIASRFFEPIYQIYARPWLSLWSNMVFGAGQVGLGIVVLVRPDTGIVPLTVGLVISNVLYLVIAAYCMVKLVRPTLSLDRATMRSILVVAAPVGVSALFATLSSRADVFLLERLRSITDVGLYSAAYRLLEVGIIATVTVITPLIPLLSRAIMDDRRTAVGLSQRIVSMAGVCTLPIAAILLVHAEALLGLLLGPDYVAAAPALRIHAVNFPLIVLTLLASSINLANGDVKHGYWNTALAATLNIGLNLWLIPAHGIAGAAVAALAAQCSMLLVSNYFMLHRFGNVYESRTWAPLLPLAVACGVVLQATAHWGVLVSSLTCCAAYIAACHTLGLVPTGLLADFIAARRDRARTSA